MIRVRKRKKPMDSPSAITTRTADHDSTPLTRQSDRSYSARPESLTPRLPSAAIPFPRRAPLRGGGSGGGTDDASHLYHVVIDFWYKFNIHLFLCQLTNKKTPRAGMAGFLFILSKPPAAQKRGTVITWSVGSEAQQNDRR